MGKQLIIFGDGGSRGNPGPAASGYAIYSGENSLFVENGKFNLLELDNLQEIYKKGVSLGIGTNNEAEWKAVILALEYLNNNSEKLIEKIGQVEGVNFYLDSKLVVEQFSGHWKIKEPRLGVLNQKAKILLENLLEKLNLSKKDVKIIHIYREFNKIADSLVNLALDNL